jgi:hypothetical protein
MAGSVALTHPRMNRDALTYIHTYIHDIEDTSIAMFLFDHTDTERMNVTLPYIHTYIHT